MTDQPEPRAEVMGMQAMLAQAGAMLRMTINNIAPINEQTGEDARLMLAMAAQIISNVIDQMEDM